MIILPESGKNKANDWSYENGKEILYFDENPATLHVVITSPITPHRIGYNRHKTNEPKEMDRVYRRIHEQEREKNAKVIEGIWGRGRAKYEMLRSRLNQRILSADTSEWEKSFIRESLRLMSERDTESQENNQCGVSAMEISEAPIEGGRTTVN
jgi:hypothetical protein